MAPKPGGSSHLLAAPIALLGAGQGDATCLRNRSHRITLPSGTESNFLTWQNVSSGPNGLNLLDTMLSHQVSRFLGEAE